jgi:hypothetical protein
MLGNVGIHPDDRRKRRHQSPIDVGKVELDPRGVLRDGINVRMRLHEIVDPAVERRLRGRIVDLTVVIAGN